MSNYYRTETGFSYFQVPNRLMELRPQLQNFAFDLWMLVHCEMQSKRFPYVMLSDDQIGSHPSWGDRIINVKEISRARALLKKHGQIHYRKEGAAWLYFAVHPVTGKIIDLKEAARQAEEKAAPKASELAKAMAEIAALKEQLSHAVTTPINPSVMKPTPKREYDYNHFEDTGAVEEEAITQ